MLRLTAEEPGDRLHIRAGWAGEARLHTGHTEDNVLRRSLRGVLVPRPRIPIPDCDA